MGWVGVLVLRRGFDKVYIYGHEWKWAWKETNYFY
jgi:hypothetical protein